MRVVRFESSTLPRYSAFPQNERLGCPVRSLDRWENVAYVYENMSEKAFGLVLLDDRCLPLAFHRCQPWCVGGILHKSLIYKGYSRDPG
ncbi:MAG: hypothetical protein CM1200mP36_08440 [Gammaproteobacteria bacterium]|nr:MAG: hypothetical protein CM1200mP36_08440 [Gammaproteobacteria bacterium]